MYHSIDHIHTLDVAITSVCNALCIDCARWWIDDQGQQHHNPRDGHRNHHWPADQLLAHTTPLTNIRTVLITGNAGDPLTHPQLAHIVRQWSLQWPHCHIEIDTNGSVGSTQQWQDLADIPRVQVRFAIDGLEDTNHIYRRSVPWHRVVHNVEQWSALGGDGTLKTIDFPWNLDQRDQIKQWSRQLGFDHIVDQRWNPELDDTILALHRANRSVSDWQGTTDPDGDWHTSADRIIQQWIDMGRPMEAECKSGSGEWLYINHDHRVWPCCYWASADYVQWHTQRHQLDHLQRQLPADWNSLDHHSLTDIIQNPLLSQLELLWQGDSVSNTSLTCIDQCGKCRNSR